MTAGPAYRYTATIVRVVDGDGFRAHVDLGFGIWLHDKDFRLAGVNARELREPGGVEARSNLAAILALRPMVTLSSVKHDKYGRGLALVTLPDGTDLSAHLIVTNWAAPWDGSGLRPLPPWPRPVVARPDGA